MPSGTGTRCERVRVGSEEVKELVHEAESSKAPEFNNNILGGDVLFLTKRLGLVKLIPVARPV